MPGKKKTISKKPLTKRKVAPKPKKKVEKLECEVCGYRLIVDETCGCVEEHALICCDKPMKKFVA